MATLANIVVGVNSCGDLNFQKEPFGCQICNIWLKIGATERGQERAISVALKPLWGLMGIFPQRRGGTDVSKFCLLQYLDALSFSQNQ